MQNPSYCPMLAAGLAALLACRAPAAVIHPTGDDSTRLATALAQAAPGETLELAAGTFALSGPVRLKSGVKLIGAGQDKTRLVYRGTGVGALMVIAGCEDVEVAHLTIDGEDNPLARDGITGGDSRRLFLHHLTLRNLGKGQQSFSHGILFSGHNPSMKRGTTDSVISDCRFEHIGLEATYGGGIRLAWGSARNRVERNVIDGTGRGGIFGDHSPELVIRGNKVSGSGGEGLGIEIWGGCPRSVIEDNIVDHWISVDKGHQSAVRRNVVGTDDGTLKGYGIEIIARDVVVTDNVVGRGAAIGLSTSNHEVKNNVFWGYNDVCGCIQWGVQMQGDDGGNAHHYFHRCVFRDTVRGHARARYPEVSGNGFRINGSSRDIVFEECTFRDNGGFGFQLVGAQVDRISFLRSRFENNALGVITGLEPGQTVGFEDCELPAGKLPDSKAFSAAPPVIGFEVPERVRVGTPVRFACESIAADGGMVEYLWDFGDGIPGVSARPEHVFQNPGRHRVTLVAWSADGRGARVEKMIDVRPGE